MWRNFSKVIQEKPQEERISCPACTGCYPVWMAHLELPQPSCSHTSLSMTMTRDGRQSSDRENLALKILHQLSLEPLWLQLPSNVRWQMSLLLKSLNSCFYRLQEKGSGHQNPKRLIALLYIPLLVWPKLELESQPPINQVIFYSLVNWLKLSCPFWFDEYSKHLFFLNDEKLRQFKEKVQKNKCLLNMMMHNTDACFGIIFQ